ncbi:hypothetical protein WCE37_13610 [Luteimonas sp. MJ250]|uniref:hypothetical protein n=1 Tax=Luteimonas sp. MJ250 TaxID=3129236 RepID=UPI0031BAEC35
MSLIGGVDVPVNGDVHDGATAIVPDLGPLNPALAGVDAELRIGARVGATRVDEIRATFEIPDAGITIADAPFNDSGWLASGGLDVGVIVPFGETFSMTLASGVRYTADLKDDDSAIGGLGLATINDTGSRFSVPVTLSARWDF